MNTIELITRIKGLTDAQRQAFLSACATRGKNKGYLKANDADNVAWSVLAGALHHSRGASFGRLWRESDEDRALRGELEQVAKTTGLTQLIQATEPAFRWNTWANRYDREAALVYIEKSEWLNPAGDGQ